MEANEQGIDLYTKILEKRNLEKSKLLGCATCPLKDNLRVKPSFTGNPVDILLIGPAPIPLSERQIERVQREKSDTSEEAYSFIDNIYLDTSYNVLDQLIRKHLANTGFSYQIWFGAECRSWKIDSTVLSCCRSNLMGKVAVLRPKLIIPMGAESMRSLGITRKFQEERGRVRDLSLGGSDYKVVTTFHPAKLKLDPGVIPEFISDLIKARESIEDKKVETLGDRTKSYLLPTTFEDTQQVLLDLLSKLKANENLVLSADIETNSLYPTKPNSKVITISFAWGEGASTTIIMDHKQAAPEYLAKLPEVKKLVAEILKTPNPKVGQNFKFDLKFLRYKDQYEVNGYFWDTQYVEHIINEDRSTYTLKDLVRQYFPEYSDYEEATKAVKGDDYSYNFPRMSKKIFDEFIKENEESFTAFPFESISIRHTVAKSGKEVRKISYTPEAYNWFELLYTACKEAWDNITWLFDEDVNYEDLPIDELCLYAAIDAEVTWKLMKKQKSTIETNYDSVELLRQKANSELELSKLNSMYSLMQDITIPLASITAEMEYYGVNFDHALADAWLKEVTEALPRLENEIFANAGRSFLINNNKELGRVLFSELGLPIIKKTPGGSASVDEESFSTLLDKTQHPILIALKDYRGAKKCRELLVGYKQAASLDGRIHTNFFITGTTSGRFSSGGEKEKKGKSKAKYAINMQNIPAHKLPFGKNIKKLLIPTNPSKQSLANMDLSTAEVMILTAYAPDEALIEAIRAGLDTHCFTASNIYKIPYDKFYSIWKIEKKLNEEELEKFPRHENGYSYSEMRQHAKNITFGMVFGMSAYKLSGDLNISFEEAEELLEKFFALYPKIRKYMDETEAKAKRNKYLDTYFGRRRHFQLYNYLHYDRHSRNQAINFLIQSTSADLLNYQLIQLHEALHRDMGGRVLAQVHDSLLFEFDSDCAGKLPEFFDHYITKQIAKQFPWLPVPMRFSTSVGPNYGETVELK